MATWDVMVRATKNGQQKLHMAFMVKAETEASARREAEEKARSTQLSYRDCDFASTTARKIRDN